MAYVGLISRVVEGDFHPGTTEDDVGAIGSVTAIFAIQAEEIGTTANNVILTKVAEDDIIPTVALNVVLTIRLCFKGSYDNQFTLIITTRSARCGCQLNVICTDSYCALYGAITLDSVIAKLAEDHVIIGTTGDIIVAIGIESLGIVYEDIPVGPDRSIARPIIRFSGHQRLPVQGIP